MAQHPSGNRALAMMALTVVAGTGLGVGAVAVLGHPLKVTMSAGRNSGGGGEVGACSQMYKKGSVYLGDIANHGDAPVTITSIRPSTSASGLTVIDYAVEKNLGGKVGNGAQQLPHLPHPHVVPAHSTLDVEALVAGSSGSKTSGFDVTLSNGHANGTDHLYVGMAFETSSCPAK